jgi:hypothetical protein
LAEEAKREQMDFVKIIDKQLKDIEADKQKEDKRKEKLLKHNDALKFELI